MAITLSNKVDVRVGQHNAEVRRYVLGAAASLGDLVYLDSDDKVQPALADAAGTSEVIGMVVSSSQVHNTTGDYAAGETVDVCIRGVVYGFSDMTNGARIYLSPSTAGEWTETETSTSTQVIKVAGYPIRSDILYIDPGPKGEVVV